MRILLTNDDGIHAPGLAALAEALKSLGDVTIVAPAAEQSGVGLSITYLHPLMVRQEQRDGRLYGHAVHGSPADCVKLGILEFCDPEPDLVVSGINSGSNVGINVLYSGTVAGAIEGAFFGKTSIAVSLAQGTPPDYAAAARYAVGVIERLLASNPPAGSLWNLNLPDTRPEGPRGLKPVRMAVRRRYDVIEKRTDPRADLLLERSRSDPQSRARAGDRPLRSRPRLRDTHAAALRPDEPRHAAGRRRDQVALGERFLVWKRPRMNADEDG